MPYLNSITNILNQWQAAGVFAYILPFLMIFAVVYGILSKTEIVSGNKGVNATIALAVGGLSLLNDYVTNFFSIIFPYTGIGLSVLLVALILMGLISEEDWAKYVWFGLGIIIFLVVVITSLSDFSWWGGLGYSWQEAAPAIVAGVIVLGLMSLIIWGGGGSSGKEPLNQKI